MSDPITRARPFVQPHDYDTGAPREATEDRPPRTSGEASPFTGKGYLREIDGGSSTFTDRGFIREFDGSSAPTHPVSMPEPKGPGAAATDHGYIREFEPPTQKSADAQVDRGLFDAIRNFSPPAR